MRLQTSLASGFCTGCHLIPYATTYAQLAGIPLGDARRIRARIVEVAGGGECLVARVRRLRITRSMCVFMLLFALVAGGCLMLRRNLAAIGSDAVAAILSRAVGMADVRVESVAIHGIRSVVMSGVRMGDALSAQRVSVVYDFRSLLRAGASPILSVTAIHAEGVEADWTAPQGYFRDDGADSRSPTDSRSSTPGLQAGAAADAATGQRQGESASAVFRGIVLVRDAAIIISRPDGPEGEPGKERRVELRDVRLEPLTRAAAGPDPDPDARADADAASSDTSWSVAIGRALCYYDRRAEDRIELADVCGALTVSDEAVTVDDLSARVLEGTVRAGFTVSRALPAEAGAAGTRIAGQVALTSLSCDGWTVTGELETLDDGNVRVDGEVGFSGDMGSGRLKARLEGAVAVPGLTPGAEGFSADGVVDIESMEIGQSCVRNMEFEAAAQWLPRAGAIAVQVRAEKTTMDQVAAALGRPVPAQGWVDWRADGEVGLDGRASVRVILTDGAVRADGWPDEWPSEFTAISGAIEVEGEVGGEIEGKLNARVSGICAEFGGGQVGLAGSPRLWHVTASGVQIHHQLVSGLVDADLTLGTGKVYSLSGRIGVRDAQMDLVVAGIQNGVPVPDADLDLDIEVGEGVKIVRGESWAWALPGVLHVQGSAGRPVVSGSLNLWSGQIDLYDVPLEIVSGGVRFTGTPGDSPQFDLVARDVTSGLSTIIAVSGVPGNMRIAAGLEDGSEKETLEGDLLVKLLLARLRLYMLSRLGRALGELPPLPGS